MTVRPFFLQNNFSDYACCACSLALPFVERWIDFSSGAWPGTGSSTLICWILCFFFQVMLTHGLKRVLLFLDCSYQAFKLAKLGTTSIPIL
jgi:hypothetical protein